MPKRSTEALEASANAVLSRLLNKIAWGRKHPRDYGTGELLYITEAEVIRLVDLREGITMTQIAEQLGVSKPVISQVVTKLEQKGYLQRSVSEKHSNIRPVSLTDKGRTASQGFRYHQDRLHEHIKGVSPEELEAYIKVLSRLEDYIDDIHDELQQVLKLRRMRH